MRFFRTVRMTPLDIGCLKWSCILLGMVVGAHLSVTVQRASGVILIAALALAVRPLKTYWTGTDQ